MSLKKDADGRRSVQVEVEVPGTPEEVWWTIATGPGVTSWFVPTEVDERVGGAHTSHFGGGFDSTSTITAWDAPHRFAAESPGWGGSPTMATEWTVEARDGGTCVVRVVHSMFADKDDWDDQLTSVESGWPAFFRVLRLYLEHFRGQPSAYFQAMAMPAGPADPAWNALTGPLGMTSAAVGERRTGGADGIGLAGTVDAVREGSHPYVLLMLDQPAPGAAFLSACPMGDKVFLSVSFYLYGEKAKEAAAQLEPQWTSWMGAQFPA